MFVLTDGRTIESLNSELNDESVMKSNELIDQISGANSHQNLLRQRKGRLSEAEHSTYNLKEPNVRFKLINYQESVCYWESIKSG